MLKPRIFSTSKKNFTLLSPPSKPFQYGAHANILFFLTVKSASAAATACPRHLCKPNTTINSALADKKSLSTTATRRVSCTANGAAPNTTFIPHHTCRNCAFGRRHAGILDRLRLQERFRGNLYRLTAFCPWSEWILYKYCLWMTF